jgi:hypothetical protein
MSLDRRRTLFGRALRAALVLVAAVLAAPALPCSICRCGDPTFNALGKQGYAARGFRLAFDWERFDKTEGPPEEEAEELVENRLTALAAYGLSEQFVLYARVPLSFRDFSAIEGGSVSDSYSTRGLSDPEVYAQWKVWSSGMALTVGRRTSLTLLAGVKTALGNNDYTIDGERVDEHAQPGTGSTDVYGGPALLYLIDARSALFVSAQYRHTGTNSYGYRYGQIWLANVAYERKLGGKLDSVVELNFRQSARDYSADEGGELPNTGGTVLYLTPRLLLDVGRGVVLRAAVQLPVVKDLNGVQEEKAVFNVGLSLVLGGH